MLKRSEGGNPAASGGADLGHPPTHSHEKRVDEVVMGQCAAMLRATVKVDDSGNRVNEYEDGPGREERLATAALCLRQPGRWVIGSYVASFRAHYTKVGRGYQSRVTRFVRKSLRRAGSRPHV